MVNGDMDTLNIKMMQTAWSDA